MLGRLAPLGVALLGLAAAQIDDDECSADTDFATRLTSGAAYGQCLEVSLVLVHDNAHPLHEDYTDRTGLEAGDCVPADHFVWDTSPDSGVTSSMRAHPPVMSRTDCPLGWNCNLVAKTNSNSDGTAAPRELEACRNGLYCHHSNSKPDEAGTCEQCASCVGDECGNCRTTFYPQVDQYSVLRLQDSCDYLLTEDPCNGVMGCFWDDVGKKCLPGPVPSQGEGNHLNLRPPAVAHSPPDTDKHMVFVPGQEFYVEMGRQGVGNGVVRSPIVVFADGDDGTEAIAMYLKLGMLNGIPRLITWEQTGKINSDCGGLQHVTSSGSLSNIRNMTAVCNSISGHCADSTKQWHMTDCGFNTYKGYYPEDGKFAGMQWTDPPESGASTIDGAPVDDCSQDMCGVKPEKGDPVGPVQLYLTWTGTDLDARDMTSGGLTYESFRQYSAFEAVKAAKDKAQEVAERSRACVTAKDC